MQLRKTKGNFEVARDSDMMGEKLLCGKLILIKLRKKYIYVVLMQVFNNL